MATIYLLSPKTNLHVGKGHSGFGIIDKLVQRDPTDEYPCIYGSSLKGALREHFEEVLNMKTQAETIFGDENSHKKGKYSFFDAHLLAIPVRSNKKSFYLATSPYMLTKLKTVVKDYFQGTLSVVLDTEITAIKELNPSSGNPIVLSNQVQDLKIEDFELKNPTNFSNASITELKKIIGSDIILMHDDDFFYQCSDYALPVIARNNLDNGQSTNLWYEQLIPREAIFYFGLENNSAFTDFEINVSTKMVQVGANATVGYGRCKIKALN